MVVIRFVREAIHRVGDEILRAKSFLDMCKVALSRFNEVGALATAHLNFLKLAVVESPDVACSLAACELRHPLERIHRVVVHADASVGHLICH